MCIAKLFISFCRCKFHLNVISEWPWKLFAKEWAICSTGGLNLEYLCVGGWQFGIRSANLWQFNLILLIHSLNQPLVESNPHYYGNFPVNLYKSSSATNRTNQYIYQSFERSWRAFHFTIIIPTCMIFGLWTHTRTNTSYRYEVSTCIFWQKISAAKIAV